MVLIRRTNRIGFSFLNENGDSNGDSNGRNGDAENGGRSSFVAPPHTSRIAPRSVAPRIFSRPLTKELDPVVKREIEDFSASTTLENATRIIGNSKSILGNDSIDPLRKKTLTKSETVEKQSNLMTVGVIAAIALLLFN